MPDIASWLTRLSLDKYVRVFTENEIDLDALRHLSEDDLKELGLPVGPRRKVLAAIAGLVDGSPSQLSSPVIPAPVPPRSEAERRQLTVMFIDLVGSTQLSQRFDPEEMRDIIRAYQNSVSAEIIRYEGHVAKLMGDGVLVYFGWPRAHEDDAERAIRAGLAAMAATATLTTPRGEPLAVKERPRRSSSSGRRPTWRHVCRTWPSRTLLWPPTVHGGWLSDCLTWSISASGSSRDSRFRSTPGALLARRMQRAALMRNMALRRRL